MPEQESQAAIRRSEAALTDPPDDTTLVDLLHDASEWANDAINAYYAQNFKLALSCLAQVRLRLDRAETKLRE